MNLNHLTLQTFRTFPLIKLGESKEIRQHPAHDDKVLIWLKPTIYSFTENRCGWIEGSNLLRAKAMKTLIPLLKNNGIDHAYEEINDNTGFIVARKILPQEDPNIEVIIKRFNSGTSFHRYLNLSKQLTRQSHLFWPNEIFEKDMPFRGPKIRFDWRNPFWNPNKVKQLREENSLKINLPEEIFNWPAHLRQQVMMRDEVLGEDFANDYIDVKQARKTALWTYAILQQYMASCNIVIYDLCLFITSNGKTVYGEISQDCGRFRHLDYGMLDKDVWRAGGSKEQILEKWELLTTMLNNNKDNNFEKIKY